MINKVTLVGNVGKDPEIRHFEGGNMVTRFPVATNENYQDRDGQWQSRTEWHDVVIWGPAAERAEKNINKGNLVYVEGKITTRKWQDKDGNDRYNTEIVARMCRSLERRDSGDALSAGGQSFPSASDQLSPASGSSTPPVSEDDDLPF